jgi:hypothetical protein
MRPETPADARRASPPPRKSPVPSGAGKSPSSLRGGNTSFERAAPKPTNSRAEEDFFSPLQITKIPAPATWAPVQMLPGGPLSLSLIDGNYLLIF